MFGLVSGTSYAVDKNDKPQGIKADASNASPAAAAPAPQRIAVPKPDRGAELVIQSVAGSRFDLGFHLDTVTLTRSGNDMILQIDKGGKVIIKGFFAVGKENPPAFREPDGTVVDLAGPLFF